MVARRPHHRGEPFAERPQRPLDIPGQLPDISGQQQPVPLRLRAEFGDDLAVLRVGHMQIAQGKQPGGHGHAHDKSVAGRRATARSVRKGVNGDEFR